MVLRPLRLALLLTALASPASAAAPATVVFLSDFGTKDSAVAVCKGVMWSIAPNLRIVDLTHQVEPYDVAEASRLVAQTLPFYPADTVFLAVVDPGVGGARKSIALRTRKGHILVGPDNGLFSAAADAEGLAEAVELKEERFFREGGNSSTFHGRDVFSPVAAHLAAGVPLKNFGPPLARLQSLPARPPSVSNGVVSGRVDYIEDPYGNVVTDIPAELLAQAGLAIGSRLSVTIGARALLMPWLRTFGDVPEKAPLALIHSRGALSFSLNMGDFAAAYAVKPGVDVTVTRAP